MRYINSLHSKLHITFKVISVLLLTVICAVQYSCAKEESKRAEWTILVYMAADNSLTEQAIQDIIEMERATVSSQVNIIVQLDPNSRYPDPRARRYKIRHNKSDYIASPVLEYLGIIDSGDYRNLAAFVNWGVKKYPSHKLSLIIWSHGSGWSRSGDSPDRGICPDQTHFNQISIAGGQFKKAFDLFSRKIDILLLDACLMMSMEVITEIYHKTNYIIGSENLTPYEGFPYQEIFDNWSVNYSSSQIAANMVKLYGESHLPGGSQNQNNMTRMITASAARSDKVEQLLVLLADFVNNQTDFIYQEHLLKARDQSYGFHIGNTEVDINEYFHHLKRIVPEPKKEEIEIILTAIEELFIAHYNDNLPYETGRATVWFPEYGDYVSGGKGLYSNLIFAQRTNWVSLLEYVFAD